MKKILIIGANSAIAEAVAKQWAAQGHTLYLLGRHPEKLKTLSQDLSLRGASLVHSQRLDVNMIETHAKVLEEVIHTLGNLDIVLIAHGTLPKQHECEQSVSCTLQAIQTNAVSTVALLTLLAPLFEKQKSGTLAVISSVAGDRGRQSNYVYGAAKAMVSTFLQGLRNRLHKSGVQVLDIKPGFVATPMTAHLKKGPLFVAPERIAQDILKGIERKKNILYTPFFWWPIMLVVKAIPERIFKTLHL